MATASFAPAGAESHGGIVHLINGNWMAWKARRHSTVLTSMAGSEVVEAVDAHLQVAALGEQELDSVVVRVGLRQHCGSDGVSQQRLGVVKTPTGWANTPMTSSTSGVYVGVQPFCALAVLQCIARRWGGYELMEEPCVR